MADLYTVLQNKDEWIDTLSYDLEVATNATKRNASEDTNTSPSKKASQGSTGFNDSSSPTDVSMIHSNPLFDSDDDELEVKEPETVEPVEDSAASTELCSELYDSDKSSSTEDASSIEDASLSGSVASESKKKKSLRLTILLSARNPL
eukprot:CAMPEP_0185744002 /NCGR_PEP_ID=MMETSP1174-20130828/1955_1 /TAXON_ID=35687 /ORGANISM="Dictyocha speculum, Strain CCMP1381" /LENGTH=147 /DNA_ID=CAMNT_0028417095 /DNA_START=410 /DNA_END=853 /DNA_ORIENTATION=+